MKFALPLTAALVLLTACSTTNSAPAGPRSPAWDSVPPYIVEALCRRLQMDAIATGTTTLVGTTQPLITAESLAAVAGATTKRDRKGPIDQPIVNRAIPIEVGTTGTCSWHVIDVREKQLSDDMVVELSAPLPNPYTKREAGLFARVKLGEDHQSWYWISLVPVGGHWPVRFVSVLFK